jgi:LysR family hydrogen peroxide-inducible transcriptional activator
MNFQQLEYVHAVNKFKHFGRAADSCNITQATLSGMIKKLEEELGIQLFDRSRKPVVTTEIGQRFIETSTTILEKKSELYALNKKEITHLSGKYTIGIIPTVANIFLPMVLPKLLENNPKLDLTIKEIPTEEIIRRLKKDQIDIGILATPLEEELIEEHILYYEPMMVYGVEGDEKKFVTSKDIANKKIWLLEEGHCFRNQVLSICEIQEKEIFNEQLKFEGGSFDTLLNLADKFGGITLIPELFQKELSPEKQKKTKGFLKPIPVREISLVTYKGMVKDSVADFLTSEIKSIITPHLSTSKYKNHELQIIGI